MINPGDFIKINKVEESIGAKVNGTFVCQNCMEPVGEAILDEDKMVLIYKCTSGHSNEAKI